MLKLDGVFKKFDSHLVINGVSLSIAKGELFVLLGSSGSGKSTLLRIISGLVSPDSGVISIGGRDVTLVPPQKRDMGFVFQNYALFRHLTVRKNIEFALQIRRTPLEERRKRSDELLDLVGLTGFADRYPEQLSGGQRQRVALARALAHQPTVLLLDEPFGALDEKIRGSLRESLRDIQRQLEITAVLVTHDQGEAFALGDRIGVLDRGRLVEVGTPQELYHRPTTEFVAKFIGGGNVLVGRFASGRIHLGAAEIPLPKGTPIHDEGAPVRFLFRPESVVLSSQEPTFSADTYLLGRARVRERVFSGAIERLRLELENLQGVRPEVAAVAYGQRYPVIEATRSSSDFCESSVQVSNYWVSIRGFHVLKPTSIRFLGLLDEFGGGYPGLAMASDLALASHGILNFLDVARDFASLQERNEQVTRIRDGVLRGRQIRGDVFVRHGDRRIETLMETQANYYDIVVMPRAHGPRSLKEGLGLLSRTILSRARTPVLLGGEERQGVKRILVCTAGGEQGKQDLKIGARLARHSDAFVCLLYVRRPSLGEHSWKRVERHLNQACSTLDALHISHEVKIRNGELFTEIVSEAAEGGYDLVVLGASPLIGGPEARALNLTNRFVSETPHPVLIVPPADG